MALVKCKECGNEISDTIKKCPHCGYKEKKPLNKKMFIIIGAITTLLFLLSGILIFTTIGKPLTENEKFAVECIKDYKAKLKNPESLQVHDIRIKQDDDKNDEKDRDIVVFYIDTSGQNGFGGNTRDVIRYVYHDEDGRAVYTGSSDDEDSDDFFESLTASVIRKEYPKLLKDDNAKISVERVMKKVDSDYRWMIKKSRFE